MKPENKVLQDAGVEVTYTTGEAAAIFRKTRQWMLWSLKTGRFTDSAGKPLQLQMINGQYIWTREDIKWAAVSCHRLHTIEINELKRIIRRTIRDTGEINERY